MEYQGDARIPHQSSTKSLPWVISQVNYEARYEALKYKLKLPRRHWLDYQSLKALGTVIANLDTHILWLTNARRADLQLLLDRLPDVQRRPFGTPPTRRIAVPWTCFADVFDLSTKGKERFLSLMHSICQARLREIIIEPNQTFVSTEDDIMFSLPGDSTYLSINSQQGRWYTFVSDLSRLVGPHWRVTEAEFDRVVNPKGAFWEAIGSKMFTAFEQRRLEKCREVQALRDRDLRPDEFDKELASNDLIGYEYWQVPSFRFMAVVWSYGAYDRRSGLGL